MVKSQIVLYIYDKLIRNEKLKIEDVINKYDIESKYYYLKNNYLE